MISENWKINQVTRRYLYLLYDAYESLKKEYGVLIGKGVNKMPALPITWLKFTRNERLEVPVSVKETVKVQSEESRRNAAKNKHKKKQNASQPKLGRD